KETHLMMAEVATAIDVDGLTFSPRGRVPEKKPRELLDSQPLPDRAAYSLRNPNTGVMHEILLKVTGKGAPVTIGAKEIYVKDKGNGEFVTFYPDAAKPELLERRVLVDKKTMAWRYADDFNTAALEVEITEGKAFIELHGEKHELHLNAKHQYEA